LNGAAAAESTTVSAWIAATARRRLRLEAGRQGLAAWEREHGALTPEKLAEEVTPIVPAMVLAEAWRGGSRQANPKRILQLCEVEDLDAARARRIGELAGASGHGDVVDVAVVEGALRRPACSDRLIRVASVRYPNEHPALLGIRKLLYIVKYA